MACRDVGSSSSQGVNLGAAQYIEFTCNIYWHSGINSHSGQLNHVSRPESTLPSREWAFDFPMPRTNFGEAPVSHLARVKSRSQAEITPVRKMEQQSLRDKSFCLRRITDCTRVRKNASMLKHLLDTSYPLHYLLGLTLLKGFPSGPIGKQFHYTPATEYLRHELWNLVECR
jgi:hypothetical protein